MSHAILSPKKLIEVALPLDAINAASVREGFIYRGNPSSLHKWWAQRPLAAARAVLFAQLVNDPASLWELQNPGLKPSLQQRGGFTQRRNYLFQLITDLVKWENTTSEELLRRARKEIRDSWREVCALNQGHPEGATLFNPDNLPGLHDPFAGGGAIPVEAQRLGLEAFASDLNQVAVLVNKAMIEIPPKFADAPPVHPAALADRDNYGRNWKGADGLAVDVRHYGAWIRDRAKERIGHLYPNVVVTAEMAANRPDLKPLVGQELKVIAWLWARTVRSPNPAFSHVAVPLVSSFVVSSKEGRESYVEPIVEGDRYRFEVRRGHPPASALNGTKAPGRGANFVCLVSGTPIDGDYIKAEGQAGRMGARLMTLVAEGTSRLYLDPSVEMEEVAASARPEWRPTGDVPARLTGGTCVPYGLREWGDLFTPRQLVSLTTLSDLVSEAREHVRHDAVVRGMTDDGIGLEEEGGGATAYGEAVALYLAFALSKTTEYSNSLSVWYAKEDRPKGLFARQAIPMVWDFPEQNVLGDIGGSFIRSAEVVADSFAGFASGVGGHVVQSDAVTGDVGRGRCLIVSTGPPYYDNIAYADLSGFFFVWLRRALRSSFPVLLARMTVPTAEELVATPHRHGSKESAERFFLKGMTAAMEHLARQSHPAVPTTIYYAFKQSETKADAGTSSSGWETFLGAVLAAGFALTGTWPMRTERSSRAVGIASNALASSIILVCRPRPVTAATTSRREFIRELNTALPLALDEMTKGAGGERSPVAPVDLSQAIIGPGMAVFSKYAAVLEADGTPMTVRTALQLINRFLAEDDFDRDTQFCLHWFDQYGWKEGAYGEADVLARAKATSVGGLKDAGVVESEGGKVRLLRPAEYPADWDPSIDTRLPVWEALHHLVRAFRAEGESGAGKLLGVNAVQSKTEAIRQLAYRLYTLCERRGWADDARAYNELVSSWASVETIASAVPEPVRQLKLFGES